jgi:hypothetical protein
MRATSLLVILLHGIGSCRAAPGRTLGRPMGYDGQPAPQLEKRASSSDSSCPQGFLCEADRRTCASGIQCPTDEVCVNFGGTPACAPSGTQLDWCALNPDTFEAVGCDGGTCCHGQCYEVGAVCCTNTAVNCTLGSACNVCPPGDTCGDSGCVGGPLTTTTTPNLPVNPPPATATTTTSSLVVVGSQPTAIPSVGTFALAGCFADSQTSRALPNGTLIATNMTAQVCVNVADQGGWQYAATENGKECYVANALTRNTSASGCDTPCAGDGNQVCGGTLQFDLYKDRAWVAPNQAAFDQAVDDLLALLQEFQDALGQWLILVLTYNAAAVESSSSVKPRESKRQADSQNGVTRDQISSARSTALSFAQKLRECPLPYRCMCLPGLGHHPKHAYLHACS